MRRHKIFYPDQALKLSVHFLIVDVLSLKIFLLDSLFTVAHNFSGLLIMLKITIQHENAAFMHTLQQQQQKTMHESVTKHDGRSDWDIVVNENLILVTTELDTYSF